MLGNFFLKRLFDFLNEDNISVLPLVRHSGGAGVGMIGEAGIDHLHHQHHQQRGHATGPQGGSRSCQGIELKLQNCFHCLLSFFLCPKKHM